MTNATATGATATGRPWPETVLTRAAGFWLAMALLGQWAFGAYIAAFYAPNLATGNYQAWAALSAMGATAYRPGDTAGNLAFGFHALAAGIIAFGGALQLTPWVRRRFPTFHRWNGRVFLLTVTGLALSGFWLVWGREPSRGTYGAFASSFNGVLILTFAALTLRTAMARRLADHRRWAMRLYLASNAQWFFRLGFFGYAVLAGALGLKVRMGDPFPMFWAVGCYLVPLAGLELYLRAKAGGGPRTRVAVAGFLVLAALAMTGGILVYSGFTLTILAGSAGRPG